MTRLIECYMCMTVLLESINAVDIEHYDCSIRVYTVNSFHKSQLNENIPYCLF